MGSIKYIWNVEIFNREPNKIRFFFANVFWWNISSGDCFHKHDIWEFSPRAGINCYRIQFVVCLSIKPIYLLIYFQNFSNFVCILLNAREQSPTFFYLPVSLVWLVSKYIIQFGFVNLLYEEEEEKMPF